jgi:deazaflavin-dependent oxidoreductase (nitroreductase family)
VQVANEVFKARSRIATGAERKAVWDQMAAMYPPFTAYQAKTSREIPVVVLEPVA